MFSITDPTTKNRNNYYDYYKQLYATAARQQGKKRVISKQYAYIDSMVYYDCDWSKEELTEKVIAHLNRNAITESEQWWAFLRTCPRIIPNCKSIPAKTEKPKRQRIVDDKLQQWEDDRKNAIEKKILKQLDEFLDAKRLAEHLANIDNPVRFNSGATWNGGGRYI